MKFLDYNSKGCTRFVILVGKYAVKIPTFLYGWEFFLRGILANLSESRTYNNFKPEGYCPVLFSFPFGFFIVMKRVRPMSREEFLCFDYEDFVDRETYKICAENKLDSFGYLEEKIVAVDYGN